jgi:Icc protein
VTVALTMAHISDLHAGSPYFVPSLMDRVVVELNELEPDIVLCTGDLTEMGFRQDYLVAQEYLERIECPRLVVIPGNHDPATSATSISKSSSALAGRRCSTAT